MAIEECAPIAELYLSGGEPFEHPEFLSIIRATRGLALSVIAYSSGTSLDATGIKPLERHTLDETWAAGLHRIDVSIYSADSARHDEVTGVPGSLSATLESCRRIASLGIPLGIHFVPVSSAADQLLHVARMTEELGATRLHVLALAPQGRALGMNEAPPESFLADVAQLVRGVQPYELVLSSALRRTLGLPATRRDEFETKFIDARGFEYPAEGARQRDLRGIPIPERPSRH